jgi:hypothetical protein
MDPGEPAGRRGSYGLRQRPRAWLAAYSNQQTGHDDPVRLNVLGSRCLGYLESHLRSARGTDNVATKGLDVAQRKREVSQETWESPRSAPTGCAYRAANL